MSFAPTPAASLVVGRYVLRERLGSGAVGDVWGADDPQIGRRVAIKFLRAPDPSQAEMRSEWENRFLLEARAVGRISHPGIVSIYDIGTASDGRPFIVMEVVEGFDLDALRNLGSPPTFEQIIRWTIEVAEALDAAHRRGVVHRDIKPANILIGADGRARITDFGIARIAESDLTRDGAFLGSPAFASPEQLCGAKVDGRADLFSLGAVLYLLCTRQRPFEGDSIGAIAYAACHLEPTPPSSINPELDSVMDKVILRALQKKPEARFQSGQEFAEALRQAAAAMPNGPLAENKVERTIPDQRIPAASTAEDRAVSIASAVAISIVRASRSAAEAAQRTASAFMAWLRVTAPQARGGIVTFAARVQAALPEVRARLSRLAGASPHGGTSSSRWWLVTALIVAVAVTILAGRSLIGSGESPRHANVWEQMRGFVGGKTSRVNLLVEHGLEDGTIELSDGGAVLLKDALNAPRKELFGASFLSYRSGSDTSTFRLAPGSHELTIKVSGSDGLELVRTMDVRVDPRSEYDLRVSVATWPMKRIGSDWDVVEK